MRMTDKVIIASTGLFARKPLEFMVGGVFDVQVETADNYEAVAQMLQHSDYKLIILDNPDETDPLGSIMRIRRHMTSIPIILLSDSGAKEKAIRLVQRSTSRETLVSGY